MGWWHLLLAAVGPDAGQPASSRTAGATEFTPQLDFEQWYAQESDRLVAVISLAAGDRELGAELMAEACARAWEKWDRVSKMDNPSGWTYTVAKNLLKRKKRREGLERAILRKERVANVPPPADPASDIWQAVADLSERQRMMVGLRYVEDLPETEIAEIMGVAAGTVAATLSQARSKLRDRLDDPGAPDDL